MEPNTDPYDQYQDLLIKAFEKVKKLAPKKYKELREECTDAIEKVKTEQKGPYNANQYFFILKMALDTKITKLMEHILYIIQKLVSYEFLDGNCDDNCIYTEESKPNQMNGRLQRRLIDAIVESICSCVTERDNQVQLQIIKSLLTIVTTFNSKVHEKSLLEAFRAIYQIHITSTNSINQNTAKASLTQMINIVFSKMEAYAQSHGLNLAKVRAEAESEDEDYTPSQASVRKQSQELGEQEVRVNFKALDQYIYSVGQNLIDDVCLHDARVRAIKEKYFELEQNCVEREDHDRLQVEKETEIQRIPLRSVGVGSSKEENPNRVPVEILNESGNISGKFGWCISCRGKANLFCKDTRHPVCSFDCKQKHLGLIDSIESESKNKNALNFYSSEEARRYFTDAVIVFKSICKLCLKEIPSSNVNTFTIRSKVLGLELILAVVEKPGTLFLTRKEFVEIVKHTLCNGLIKYCVSQEKQIFALSTSIFYYLFLHFREHLKSEIYVFIQTIFIKILDSGNSNYHHKYLILEVFAKLAESIKHMLEIFLNYDCQQGNEDIFSKMMDSLAKIAQGKFSKSEHSYIITPAEELSLRLYALQIMVTHLRGMNKTIEAETAEERLATRNSLAQSKTHENTSNEGEEENSQKDNLGSFDSTSFYSQQQPVFDNYEKTRALKNELNKASFKFNMKPKNGIAYMQSKGLICKEPKEQMVKEIVAFLKNTPSLDKTIIGDYMGENIEINKLVLYSFIDQIDFKGVSFVDSLRLLLQGFRLPGEGQKVDRIMEKFGEKYVHDNPDIFASAESVYLLSYATIMAHTSIHNPQAQKNFMTIEDYTKMLRGIDGGKNLDPELVTSIYRTIEKEPFTLDEDEDLRLKLLGQSANSKIRKQETYIQEADMLAKRGKAHISSKGGKKETSELFILVTETEHIKTMFEDTWSANLAVFSVLLEESDDERITQLCLEGFLHAIKVSGYYRMPTERDAFVSSLSKFTQISTLREIKDKNLDCVAGLIQLAVYDGNFLGNSWYYVLDCISKVDYMHVLGSGGRKDSEFFNAQKGSRQNKAKAQKEQAMAQKSEIIANAIDPNKIDLIIQKSVNLDGDAVIDFISNLCRVSSEELDDEENPRKFSLQRLVEVADFNMDNRIRFTWNKIWSMLSDHFSQVGSHPNLHVALYSIDSLRQLADKFLLKEEFTNYHFQKDFLKPFETIMLNNLHTRYDIKEYIVMCIANMCVSKSRNLKSGWVVVINIFTLAAQDLEERLVKQSFEALKHSLQTNSNLAEENFIELINCLGKFSKNQFEQQAVEALQCIADCAKDLTNKPELMQRFIQHNGVQYLNQEKDSLMRSIQNHQNVEESQEKLKKLTEAQKDGKTDQKVIQFVVLKALWFPILNNLTNIIMEKRERMQQRARDLMFQVFKENIKNWPFEFWQEILQQILIPMLDDIQLAVDIPGKNIDYEFYRLTTQEILQSFVTFFNDNVSKLEQVVPPFIQTLCHFIKEIKEKHIAQTGVGALKHFLLASGEKLSPDSWNEISEHVCHLFDSTTPKALLKANEDDEVIFNEDSCYTQCIVQLLLIQCVQEITTQFYGHISEQNLNSFLEALDKSHEFAQNFNKNHSLRLQLWRKGFMSELQMMPGLIRQEWESLSATLKILFQLFHQPKESKQDPEKLFGLCEGVIRDYARKSKELQMLLEQKENDQENEEKKSDQELQKVELEENEFERQLANLRPIVSEIILPEIESLKHAELMKLVKTLCPQLIQLTLCESLEIREANAQLLTRIFGDLQKLAGLK